MNRMMVLVYVIGWFKSAWLITKYVMGWLVFYSNYYDVIEWFIL